MSPSKTQPLQEAVNMALLESMLRNFSADDFTCIAPKCGKEAVTRWFFTKNCEHENVREYCWEHHQYMVRRNCFDGMFLCATCHSASTLIRWEHIR